ncbi:MAG: hypothetical protein P4L34_04090 [Paludibacter sp.]|nr:hypothetical protein [Paludibacter sp.]
MKIYAMIGSLVVVFALVFYSIGFVKEQRKKLITSRVLLFFTLGVIFDISATTLMILGSTKGLLTFHGFIGYSSLLGMCIDTFLLWRHNLKKGPEVKVSQGLNIFSRVTYIWWVIAFITGGLLVALRHA